MPSFCLFLLSAFSFASVSCFLSFRFMLPASSPCYFALPLFTFALVSGNLSVRARAPHVAQPDSLNVTPLLELFYPLLFSLPDCRMWHVDANALDLAWLGLG